MPIFEIEHSGKSFEVDAPNQDAALSGFQNHIGQTAFTDADMRKVITGEGTSTPVTAGGLYSAANQGVINTTAGLAGLPKTIANLGASGLEALGANDLAQRIRTRAERLPTTEQAKETIYRDYNQPGWIGPQTAGEYKPQNKWEERAQTGGEYLLNAALPGGAIARVANVALPAASQQAVKEAGGGEMAQALAALGGSAAATKLGNVTERLAAGSLPSIERGAANSLPDVAQGQYRAITQNAVNIPTTIAQRRMIADGIEQHLHGQNFRRANAEETYKVLDNIRQGSKAPDVADLMTARRQLGNIKGEDGVAAGQAREVINQVLDAYIPGLGRRLAEADQNWNAYKTARMLSAKTNKAEFEAARANSGLNLGNRIRSQASQIATNPQMTRYMRPEDVAALENLSRGTAMQNATRWAGNLMGGGGGLGALAAGGLGAGAGAAYGTGEPSWLGAVAPVLGGLALKRSYNRSIAKGAQNIADTVLARAPAAQGINYVPYRTIGQSFPGGFVPASPTIPGLLELQQ
jgi:hypothetical protein